MAIHPEVFARYAQMHVPRYTSYPTAPHFSAAIDQAEYRRWLRQMGGPQPVSVYLHIPFCREMCWYCGCHTTVVNRSGPVNRYVSALSDEIRLVAADLPKRLRVGHLHWGGGSPTLLSPDAIDRLSLELSETFELSADSENAIEVDPRVLPAPVVAAFARSGINRASLGVQTFDPVVQAAINRVQSYETTAAATDLLWHHGIGAINLDLVYGLPFQTTSACVDTVNRALQLHPDRLAVFGYAHVPSLRPHQRKIDEAALPNATERANQFRAICDALIGAGYIRIGFDHFALPSDSLAKAAKAGALHRNFQGYTVDSSSALLGFGASAIGRLPDGYVQNAVRIPDYERRVQAGLLATVRGYALSDEDRRRGKIIEHLMCDYRADVGGVAASLDELEADGIIRRSGTVVEIVEDARPLVRTVAAAFDAYLPGSGARHVVAI